MPRDREKRAGARERHGRTVEGDAPALRAVRGEDAEAAAAGDARTQSTPPHATLTAFSPAGNDARHSAPCAQDSYGR